jgi:peptide deformylase
MATFPIRVFGDLGLKQRCPDVTEFDGALARLADDMIETMYAAPGVGLAANQVGVQKRIFVYDAGDGPFTVVNPTIVETSESWEYEEGCLSVPGLYFPIVRPRCVTLSGYDLNGKEFVREGQDLLGRIFLHETDHLDGHLLLDRLDADLRREAMKILRSGGTGGQVRRLGVRDGAGDPPPRPE